jgi:AcrR family transcriptional regulator
MVDGIPRGNRPRARAGSVPVSPAQIEREAVRLFSEKTYPDVGMRDISDAVGILPGSLYVHVKSKEEILFNIVERGILNYLVTLTPIVESAEPAGARLRKTILAYMNVLDSNLTQTRVAVFQWSYLSQPNRERVVKLRERFRQLFTTLVEEGISSGEFIPMRHPGIVTIAVIGLLNSTMHWYCPTGTVSAEKVGEQLAELVLGGLRP